MMEYETLTRVLALTTVGAPCALVAILGGTSLVDRPLSERGTSRVVGCVVVIGLLAALGIGLLMILSGTPHLTVEIGSWVTIPNHFHFSVKLLYDTLSLPFLLLSFLLCGIVGAFTSRYLHREPGYNRFYVLYSVFMFGMVLTSLAGTIETLFAGWELVGLSSALLVAFFHERPSPVRNGLRVWTIYRISDAALLSAAVLLHHVNGHGDFDVLLGMGAWPLGHATITQSQAFLVGMLLILAAAGKSALVPFSGWLPRAMEGPTPSSAIFYGSISVHLGAYLLLRVSPLLDLSGWLCVVLVAMGLLTAMLGAVAARVQTDIKCALSFASVTQVGIIVAEIGCGLRWIALAHIIGHACMRTLQFLRAPSLLRDYRIMEDALGSHLPRFSGGWLKSVPVGMQSWLYRLALERGYLDAWLNDYVARPILWFFRVCDSLERRWLCLLSGGQEPVRKLQGPGSQTPLRSFSELLPPHLMGSETESTRQLTEVN